MPTKFANQDTLCHLESDYNNGAHEAVLQHLIATNDERTQSYGDDRFSEYARQLIREACEAPDAQIWFLAGGTQTNATIIDCALQPYEGVLCPETAHINVHEAGAVEFTGHKVIALPSHKGKLDVGDLQAWLSAYFADETAEHMVRPGMVHALHGKRAEVPARCLSRIRFAALHRRGTSGLRSGCKQGCDAADAGTPV